MLCVIFATELENIELSHTFVSTSLALNIYIFFIKDVIIKFTLSKHLANQNPIFMILFGLQQILMKPNRLTIKYQWITNFNQFLAVGRRMVVDMLDVFICWLNTEWMQEEDDDDGGERNRQLKCERENTCLCVCTIQMWKEEQAFRYLFSCCAGTCYLKYFFNQNTLSRK